MVAHRMRNGSVFWRISSTMKRLTPFSYRKLEIHLSTYPKRLVLSRYLRTTAPVGKKRSVLVVFCEPSVEMMKGLMHFSTLSCPKIQMRCFTLLKDRHF